MGLRRLLTGIGATFATALLLAATASAKTVYDYVYSGTYIDGTAAGKPFTTQVAGIGYDRHAQRLVVVNGSATPGVVSRYTLSGTPVTFASLGTPWFTIEPSVSATGDVAIDQSGMSTDGNFYVRAGGFSGSKVTGYKPDGSKIPFDSNELSGEGECGLAVTPDGQEVTFTARGGIFHRSPNGEPLGQDFVGPPGIEPGTKIRGGETLKPCHLAYDNNGDIYGTAVQGGFNSRGPAFKVSPTGLHYYMLNHNPNGSSVAVDYSTNEVFVLNSGFGANNTFFELFDEDGRLLGGGWGKEDAGKSYPGLVGPGAVGIAVDPATEDVWIANKRDYGAGSARVEKFVRTNPHVIPDTTALPAEYPDPAGEHILLNGNVNAGGVETTECYFAYGSEEQGIEEGIKLEAPYEVLTQTVPCEQGNNFSGTGDHVVTAEIPTAKGELYFYKLVAKNGNEQLAPSNVQKFVPQGPPKLTGLLAVDRVNTDGVRFSTEFDPNGGNGSVHFEWGEKGEGFTESSPESDTVGWESPPTLFNGENGYVPGVYPVSIEVKGLEPGTTYEYRAVVKNEADTVVTQTEEFTTYVPDSGIDNCGNAEVRRQQNGSLLPDCRAYELVSAADQGGYDVESEIVPGQAQLEAYPGAKDRVLYSMHFGIIPGIAGSPTNLGLDPYVATRSGNGWTTTYEGLPSNGMPDKGAFGSPLLGADASLRNFAFGGPDICDPCFSDESINVPLRRPNGDLEKGMAGPLNPPADPVGEVRKPLSDDGSHFIFGADEKFHEDGNEGSVSIYDRNLATGSTQVASTMPNGSTMTGEVAQLDISSDGSHIVIGKVVGEDGAENRLYDLYMHVGTSANSIEVVDTTNGVIYNGMTDDGSQVFFTTRDAIAGDGDTTSADLFRADVEAPGPATVTRLSTGSSGTGNTDSCEPVVDWNVPSGTGDCSVVVPADGAGVARNDGTVYFISPEKLDGGENGTANQANLYVVEPGGSPDFVGEIDSSAVKAPPQPPAHPVISTNFITSLSNPEGMAIDQVTGDIYVAERGAGGRIARYDSTGAPLKFAEGPGAGTNRISNSGIGGGNESSIAIDSSGSPLGGAIYVRNFGGTVAVWDRSGVKLGELTGFGEVCGVAVDQETGELFVGDYFGRIRRFVPNSKSTPVSKADYTETTIKTSGQSPCHVAADSAGHVFAASYSGGAVKKYNVADFGADPEIVGTEVSPSSFHLSADPATGELYVSLGNRIVIFDSSGNEIGEVGSSASLGSSSDGVAVLSSTKEVFALNGTNVTKFGYEVIPYEPINNPAILHGVNEAGEHHYEDIQVTPDGHYALFATPVSLTGYQNLNHYEIHRYDTVEDELLCVSCAPTNAVGKSDVKLSPHGLNLADDGRVFFTTLESLTLRDTNEKKDAYEWNEGKVALISSGIGQDDSALLSVSADGNDAYFFTRDVLVPFDKSGNVVKIYDARVNGGFPYDPLRGLCRASDECHGAGTQPPPPPDINTVTGPEQARPPVSSSRPGRCKKRKVRRRGRCVPRKRQRKRHTTHRHG